MILTELGVRGNEKTDDEDSSDVCKERERSGRVSFRLDEKDRSISFVDSQKTRIRQKVDRIARGTCFL